MMQSYVNQGQDEQQAPTDVVTKDHYRPIGGLVGDFDLSDVEIPYLAIVQGQGKLARDRRFHAGDLVLMKEYVIPQPMRTTVFFVKAEWVQNIQFEEGVIPVRFASKEEVVKSGGNTESNIAPGDPNNFVRSAELWVAIELDGELAEQVPGVLEFEDKQIARAKWTVKGSNYKSLVRRLNLIEGPLRLKNPPQTITNKWGLITVAEKQAGDFWVHVADFKVGGDNSPEYVEFLQSVF